MGSRMYARHCQMMAARNTVLGAMRSSAMERLMNMPDTMVPVYCDQRLGEQAHLKWVDQAFRVCAAREKARQEENQLGAVGMGLGAAEALEMDDEGSDEEEDDEEEEDEDDSEGSPDDEEEGGSDESEYDESSGKKRQGNDDEGKEKASESESEEESDGEDSPADSDEEIDREIEAINQAKAARRAAKGGKKGNKGKLRKLQKEAKRRRVRDFRTIREKKYLSVFISFEPPKRLIHTCLSFCLCLTGGAR